MPKKDNDNKVERAIALMLPRLRNVAAELAALALELEGLIGGPVASGDGSTDPGPGGG